MAPSDDQIPSGSSAALDDDTSPDRRAADEADAAQPLDPTDVDACVRVLEAIAAARTALADIDVPMRERLLVAAGRVAQPSTAELRAMRKALRRRDRSQRAAHDSAILDATGIREGRRATVFQTPALPAVRGLYLSPHAPIMPVDDVTTALGVDELGHELGPELKEPRKCYVCKTEFLRVHFFYDQMCAACADFNYRKRTQTADLRGRTALITGARVKIGYQAAILMLRAGAHVIVTTRFPHDAAKRFAREDDFAGFADRLEIHGLDLRHTPSVELFAAQLCARVASLDFIIHNACQTVRRPPGFYAHLVAPEQLPLQALSAAEQPLVAAYHAAREHAHSDALGFRAPALLSQAHSSADDTAHGALPAESASVDLFPLGRLDADLQQVDLRALNSWRLTLAEVPTVELLEVQLVNAVAPFVLSARLKPLMLRTRTFDKHIVNVSAMEGQFNRSHKTDKHPHTNMAKAALNMLTRTSASDYARDGIFMNSVDTGWVTDEDPIEIARPRSTGFIRRSTSSMVRHASSIRSSMASTRASTCSGAS